ncbi:MAG TPA: phosphoserine phosphatase SerB [Burkholderiales bacterium]|nr:phosphoserine phosphatase SerB [Burkholderiales bacterium]
MNLVIQGRGISPETLDHVSTLAKPEGIERISESALRLRGVSYDKKIYEYCESASLDCAYVPEHARLSDFGLVVMDMDSTLITIECIDEIADMQGIKPMVSAITESAMRGEIDFSESLRRRVALLSGLDESALSKVYEERLRLSPGAEIMLHKLKSLGIRTLLVSGGFTFFTERLKSRLGLDFTASNTLEVVDGKLTGRVLGEIVDAGGKAYWLNRVREMLYLPKDAVIAIGDGANDLKMLAEAGTGIAYHAKPVVREKATYALNHVGLDGLLNLFPD